MIPAGILGSAHYEAAALPALQDVQSVNAKTTSTTFSGMALGAADPSRTIVVVITHNVTDNSLVTGVTIGGVTATIDWTSSTNKQHVIARASVPTGTTGDVVVTYNNADAGPGRTCALYSVASALTVASAAGSSSPSSGAISVTLPDSGAWCVAGVGTFNTSSGSLTWTNVAEEYDSVEGASFYPSAVSGGSGAGDGLSRTITATSSPASSQMELVAVGYDFA